MPSAPTDPARRGRPRSEAAESHAAILDAVHALLQETSVRDLTMEAIARRAKVGKPTLYKWWPSKAALVFATFHDRIAGSPLVPPDGKVEDVIRIKMRNLVRAFNGLFGKVMADLIAEGQGDADLLRELWDRHMDERRSATIADVERAVASGEFAAGTNAALLVDAIVSPIFFHLLVRHQPLTEAFADALVSQVLAGARPR